MEEKIAETLERWTALKGLGEINEKEYLEHWAKLTRPKDICKKCGAARDKIFVEAEKDLRYMKIELIGEFTRELGELEYLNRKITEFLEGCGKEIKSTWKK